MTTLAITNLLSSTSFACQESQSQIDHDKIKQNCNTVLEKARGHVNKLEGAARAEGVRMLYEAEQALSDASKGCTNLKDFTNITNDIIEKLNSIPKLLPMNREPAKSLLSSLTDKIAKTTIQAGQAAMSKDTVAPTQVNKHTPDAPEKQKAIVTVPNGISRSSALSGLWRCSKPLGKREELFGPGQPLGFAWYYNQDELDKGIQEHPKVDECAGRCIKTDFSKFPQLDLTDYKEKCGVKMSEKEIVEQCMTGHADYETWAGR